MQPIERRPRARMRVRAAFGATLASIVLLLPSPAAARAQATASAPASGPASPTHDQQQHQAPVEQQEYPSLRIAGFGDVNFSALHEQEGPARGFSLGQFTLHMTSPLSPRVTFFGEITFSARSDAGTGTPPATGFNAEIERMILRFDQSDQFKVSFGRYHTPVNWWNTQYHHGAWLQTTISRPELIQFGGRFLPVHFVGALVEGSVPAGGLNLNYKAGVGNGRASVISRGGDAGDVNGHRAWLLNGFSKPDEPFGLEFGGSFYADRITQTSREFDEKIAGGYVVWHKEDPEIIAEYAGVRHQETGTSAVTWNHGYYIQAAYRLPWAKRLLKPYYRFEHIGLDPNEVVFAGLVQPIDGSTVGLRYDASQFAAIKGEYRNWRRAEGTPRNYGGFFQVCFTF